MRKVNKKRFLRTVSSVMPPVRRIVRIYTRIFIA